MILNYLLQLLVDEYLQCWMTPPNYTLFLTVSVFLVIFIGFPPAVFVTTVIETTVSGQAAMAVLSYHRRLLSILCQS